jgi:hypothetical protein
LSEDPATTSRTAIRDASTGEVAIQSSDEDVSSPPASMPTRLVDGERKHYQSSLVSRRQHLHLTADEFLHFQRASSALLLVDPLAEHVLRSLSCGTAMSSTTTPKVA